MHFWWPSDQYIFAWAWVLQDAGWNVAPCGNVWIALWLHRQIIPPHPKVAIFKGSAGHWKQWNLAVMFLEWAHAGNDKSVARKRWNNVQIHNAFQTILWLRHWVSSPHHLRVNLSPYCSHQTWLLYGLVLLMPNSDTSISTLIYCSSPFIFAHFGYNGDKIQLSNCGLRVLLNDTTRAPCPCWNLNSEPFQWLAQRP